jgi:hypothetical protein
MMADGNREKIQAGVENYVETAEEAVSSTRRRAADMTGDYVRTYDTRVRRAASQVPVPIEEAVGRYPWAALSIILFGGVVVGLLSGSLLTRLAGYGNGPKELADQK